MKRLALVGLFLVACGGSQEKPKGPETVDAPPPKVEAKKPEPVEAPPVTPPAPIEIKESTQAAEKCEPSWGSCVTVTDKKVEARPTQLIGDPSVSDTKSGTTDGSKPLDLTLATGETMQINLKRKANDKNEVTMKLGKGGKLGPEIVVDKRDGSINEFTHIGIIATVAGGKAMIDIRYMR